MDTKVYDKTNGGVRMEKGGGHHCLDSLMDDERNRELLRQRPHGEFLGHPENRVDLSSPFRNPSAGHSGDYRVH